MTAERDNREFCWERVRAADGLFRITLVFSGQAAADRLLPLHALFASIEQLVATISEEEVALRKLLWWKEALSGEEPGGIAHPVIAELHRSGAASLLSNELISRFVENARKRIAAVAPRDTAALEVICRETGSVLAEMELAVCEVEQADSVVDELDARRLGLVQLARESTTPNAQRAFWWIPLDLLARHGLSRSEIPDPRKQDEVASLVADCFSIGAGELRYKTDISVEKQDIKRYIASKTLITNKLKYMNKNSVVEWADTLRRPRIADVFRCWRAVRNFNRPR